jgi:hypothetical protein
MSTDTKDASQKTDSSRHKSSAFVDYIINRCQADNGLRAALKRADNPATEYQSWEVLAGFHVNLEYENQRLPHATVAAAIARAKVGQNGTPTSVTPLRAVTRMAMPATRPKRSCADYWPAIPSRRHAVFYVRCSA